MATPNLSGTISPLESPLERPAPPPAVELKQVTRVFGVMPAVVRVDLTIASGEVLLVRGSNGAGKTTLLRLIATAISPTYGGGTVLGHDLVRERGAIRSRTELMGHRGRFYLDLTGAENLRFAGAVGGHVTGRVVVDAALARVSLSDAAHERVRTYSQGMRQRLALARVLLRRPDVLLLDEPYAGLDRDGRDLVNDVIREARAEGRTVVLATHEAVPSGLLTRSVTMDRGRVFAAISSPREQLADVEHALP